MFFKNLAGPALVILSVAGAVLLCEWLARFVIDPVDFLSPKMAVDPMLNHRIAANSGGHDDWGFRNPGRDDAYEIVAIGDSMTYGVASTMAGAWPHQLAGMLDTTVYSMALGGYGPLQYLHLLETKALELQPQLAVVAIYLGNDLMDSFNLAAENSHWSSYLPAHAGDLKVAANEITQNNQQQDRAFDGLRHWLAQNSLIYSIIKSTGLGDLIREREVSAAEGLLKVVNPAGSTTYLESGRRIVGLDTSDKRIQVGLEIIKRAIEQIVAVSDKNQIEVLFLVLPTKERVYADYVSTLGVDDTAYANLVSAETEVNEILVTWLNANEIEYVDLLNPLRRALTEETIYPPNDGHPNAAGYRVIAGAVALGISEFSLLP